MVVGVGGGGCSLDMLQENGYWLSTLQMCLCTVDINTCTVSLLNRALVKMKFQKEWNAGPSE